MASLKKRNGYYSLSFKTTVDGKTIKKTFALGTRRKQIAEQKKNQYEKLYESGELNPLSRDGISRSLSSGKWISKEPETARFIFQI